MRRPRSTSAEPRAIVAIAAALVVVALAGRARAQACCTGTALVVPGRLRPYEELAVGAQLRATTIVGSFDASRAWVPSPAGTGERDLGQDLFGAVRVLEHAQLAALVPFVETWRAAGGRTELGGGVGDASASARWDFTLAADGSGWPGIAVLAGAVIPTGRPVDRASHPLATDATGEGVWQLSAGAQIEQTWGRMFASALASIAWHDARTIGGLSAQRAPRLATQLAIGHATGMTASLALVGTFEQEGEARVDGVASPGSAQRRVRAGIAGGWAMALDWRAQGSLLAPVPVSGAGANDPAGIALALSLTHVWM